MGKDWAPPLVQGSPFCERGDIKSVREVVKDEVCVGSRDSEVLNPAVLYKRTSL